MAGLILNSSDQPRAWGGGGHHSDKAFRCQSACANSYDKFFVIR